MGHFLCGVERVKCYVNVHLHCMVSNLKITNKMSTLPSHAKISADAHSCVVCVYKSALYCAMNNHFVLFEYPFGTRVVECACVVTNRIVRRLTSRDVLLTKEVWVDSRHPKILAVLKQLQTCFNAKREKGVGTPFPCVPAPL